MRLDPTRLALAIIITLVAFPTVWWLSRSDDNAQTEAVDSTVAPTVDAATDDGVMNPIDGASAGNVMNPIDAPPPAPTTTERPGSNLPPVERPSGDPSFMDGPGLPQVDDVSEIAVPARPEVAPVRADASFSGSISGDRICLVRDFRIGTTLAVTNLDNGRSITCVAALAPRGQEEEIVLHTASFERLADLTEAPIPVEIQS